jgi:hypothetical protein
MKTQRRSEIELHSWRRARWAVTAVAIAALASPMGLAWAQHPAEHAGGDHGGGHSGASHSAPAAGGGAHWAARPHFGAPPHADRAAAARAPAQFNHGGPRPSAPAAQYRGPAGNAAFATPWRAPSHGAALAAAAPGRFADRSGGFARAGWDHGGAFARRRWDGGYWHGHFWPAVYYGTDFAWFVPVLPAYAVTYWWGGVPYYYYNDAYYTWNAGDGGYVASEPPPVADGVDDGTAGYAPSAPDAGAAPDPNAPDPNAPIAAGTPSAADLYAYPMNGQSPEQQAADRSACAQWAASQAPTSGNWVDYQRALGACLTGRGYSVE